jgi:hypothetical protein
LASCWLLLRANRRRLRHRPPNPLLQPTPRRPPRQLRQSKRPLPQLQFPLLNRSRHPLPNPPPLRPPSLRPPPNPRLPLLPLPNRLPNLL